MDKKFDIILSNPPYAQTLYLKFLEKELDIANNVISINPSALIKRDSKHFDSYKKKFDPYLSEIEELDSKIFEDTSQQSVCIMVFKNNKKDLHIKYIDGNEEIISGILEKDNSGFTDYEKEIVKYLYNEHPNLVPYIDLRTVGKPKSVKNDKELLKKYVDITLSKLPDNKAYLICNAADGSMKAKYFSSKIGQIFDNKEDLREFLINRGGVRNHYLYFNSYNAARNCKSAMERPLLRFTLFRTQSDQHLTPSKDYKYIPDIDWSNIESDYDILKACNCPENKIEEYIQYVTNIINKKDRK